MHFAAGYGACADSSSKHANYAGCRCAGLKTGPGAPYPYVAGSAQDNPVVPNLLDADKPLVVAQLNPLFTTQQTTEFKGPAR